MRKAFFGGALALLAAAIIYGIAHAIPNNQALSRSDIYAGIGTSYAWSGTAQGWSTDHRLVSHTDFVTFVQNSGACPGASNYIMTQGDAIGCAVVANVHTPILANNSFAAGAITGWTSSFTYAGCVAGGTATAVNAADEDADTGYATQGSGNSCYNGNTANVSLTQSVSIAGNPSNQSWSVWYKWTPIAEGDDVNCNQQFGAVNNLIVQINGHTETTIPSPVGDNAWHKVSGSTSDLINGTNTFTVLSSVSGARGSSLNGATGFCTIFNIGPQTLQLDNAVLTASW